MFARRAQLERLNARLNALSPLAVLERGYALVLDEKGALVRSTQQLTKDATVTTRLSDGSFSSHVEEVTTFERRKNPKK